MPWINGRWRPEGWQTGGFGGGPVGGGFPGLLGDVSSGPGVPNPPQINPPGYGQGPQMQPTPYQPTQWAGPDAIYPNWGDPEGLYANDVALTYVGDPYQPHTPWQSGLAPRQPWSPPPQMPIQGPPIPPRMAAPPQQPIYDRGPQMRPTLPPQVDYQPPGLRPTPPPFTTVDPIRPPMPPPITIVDPIRQPPPQLPPTIDPKSDHAFNVRQREKTKIRLANERSITKAHLANLRGKGVSAKTIAKAKAKAQGRYTKIKGQSLRRGTTDGKSGESE